MNGSVLRGTSSATRTMDQREIAALRPAAAPPARPRKAPAPARQVTSGIACFCGERFAETEALAFMLHLRAEVGDDLARLERRRARNREYERERRKDPEWRERRNERRKDPEYRARERANERERRKDPEYRARMNERERERRKDPEWRERRNERRNERRKDPEYRARERANERERRKAKARGVTVVPMAR